MMLINAFIVTTMLFGQKPNEQSLLNNGLYKLTTILGNEIKTIGYYYFEKNNQYKYFGDAKYNQIGKFGNYYAYSIGTWKIDKDGVLIISDKINKTDNRDILKMADSICYNASYRMPYDSTFFNIQVLDENAAPLSRELIEIKGYANKLLESDELGRVRINFQTYSNNTKNENLIYFFGNEPYYKTIIPILLQYNYHEIKVFLKKIPENGFLPTEFIQKNWRDRILKINQDTLKVGKYSYFTKVSPKEVVSFIEEIEKENTYFKSDFIQIKRAFTFKE